MKRPAQDNQQFLEQIPQMQEYRFCQSPLLSQEKKTQIQQKLELQKVAMNNAKDRDVNSDYYIKYNYNPFLQFRGRSYQAYQSFLKLSKDNTANIVNRMADMEVEGVQLKTTVHNQAEQLNNLQSESVLISEKMLTNMKKLKINQQEDLSQPKKQKEVEKNQTSKELKTKKGKLKYSKDEKDRQNREAGIGADGETKVPIDIEIKLSKQDTEKIVMFKEPNYFMEDENKKINIFKIGNDDDEDLAAKEILEDYYFCTNSTIEKLSKVKIPIYRDLSNFARQLMLGKKTREDPVDYIETIELSYKLTQLMFCDVMSVASNRFNPDFLNKLLNGEEATVKEVSDTSSEEKDQRQIILHSNQRHIQTDFVNFNQEIQEIKDYRALKLNKPEQEYLQNCQKKLQNVTTRLDLKKQLVSKTVLDQMLHDNIEGIVEHEMKNFIELDQQIKDPDRLVRMNKTNKSKREFIKIKALLSTLEYKNQQDVMLMDKNRGHKKVSR